MPTSHLPTVIQSLRQLDRTGRLSDLAEQLLVEDTAYMAEQLVDTYSWVLKRQKGRELTNDQLDKLERDWARYVQTMWAGLRPAADLRRLR